MAKTTKARTSRKKVTEGQYEVTMTKTTAGKPETVTKMVVASSQPEAIQKASAGILNSGSYTGVVAREVGGATPPSQTAKDPVNAAAKAVKRPQQPAPAAPGMGGGVLESLDYPYVIALPAPFQALLEGIEIKGLTLANRYGRVYVTISNRAVMERFCKSIATSKRPEAKIVLEGIKQSRK